MVGMRQCGWSSCSEQCWPHSWLLGAFGVLLQICIWAPVAWVWQGMLPAGRGPGSRSTGQSATLLGCFWRFVEEVHTRLRPAVGQFCCSSTLRYIHGRARPAKGISHRLPGRGYIQGGAVGRYCCVGPLRGGHAVFELVLSGSRRSQIVYARSDPLATIGCKF